MKDFQTFKFVLHETDNFFNFISECISKPLSVHQKKKKKKKKEKVRHLVKLRAIFLLFILVFVILLFDG